MAGEATGELVGEDVENTHLKGGGRVGWGGGERGNWEEVRG